MDIKKSLEEELNRPMNRREFLARVGSVALSLVGIGIVVRSLQHSTKSWSERQGKSSGRGYGSSPYGRG